MTRQKLITQFLGISEGQEVLFYRDGSELLRRNSLRKGFTLELVELSARLASLSCTLKFRHHMIIRRHTCARIAIKNEFRCGCRRLGAVHYSCEERQGKCLRSSHSAGTTGGINVNQKSSPSAKNLIFFVLFVSLPGIRFLRCYPLVKLSSLGSCWRCQIWKL